jgi:hypothetical protein
MFKQQLTFAEQALAEGNLAVCEIVCRDILDVAPQNSTALNLLGVVAANVGAIDHSTAYFEAALSAEPNNERIRKNFNFLKNSPRHQKNENLSSKYLVIKSWGFGFWSDVSQVIGSLLLAEITGRIPVTHWGKNSLFSNGSNRDSFKGYFNPASNVTLVSVLGAIGVGSHASYTRRPFGPESPLARQGQIWPRTRHCSGCGASGRCSR